MPPAVSSNVHVDFCVLSDPFDDAERWVPVSGFAPHDAVALWERSARVTCCTLQMGFRFTIDGVVWNGEAMDELGMAESWLPCVHALTQGGTRATPWAWEQSGARLCRRGHVVDMLDVHHAGQVVCPWVRVRLPDLARALADAAEVAAGWLDAVEAAAGPDVDSVLADQRHLDWRVQAAALRAGAEAPASTPPGGDPGPLPEAWLAALVHDRAGLRTGPPDLREEDRTVLHLAVHHRWLEGVEELLARGAPLDARDGQGFTPLQQACRRAQGRPGPHPIVAALLAHGAVVDPLSAILMDDPVGFRAATARGERFVETMSWWAFSRLNRRGPVPAAWAEALAEVVALGVPVGGRPRGLGGWSETPIEAATRAGNADLAAFLRGLEG